MIDLYRFYDRDDELLYVGISLSAVARASQHKATQPWWHEVARMDVEHLLTDDRVVAELAERRAIETEHPRHNIVWNRARVGPPAPAPAAVADGWAYRSLSSGYVHKGPLSDFHLIPEFDYENHLDLRDDDGEPRTGPTPLRTWAAKLAAEGYDLAALPVNWFVEAPHGTESAPFGPRNPLDEDFLTVFTWPTRIATGEPLNWNTLPVRYPWLEHVLGVLPTAMQPTFNLTRYAQGIGLELGAHQQRGAA